MGSSACVMAVAHITRIPRLLLFEMLPKGTGEERPGLVPSLDTGNTRLVNMVSRILSPDSYRS